MGKNRKQRKPPAKDQLFERAERELSKGNAKEALKDAKVCYRDDPNPDHRRLLERAYVGRVEQLQKMKLPAEARAVLAELLKLDPKIPEIRDQIPRLQVILGDTAADSQAVFQQNPALLAELADQAVLDPRMPAPDHSEVRVHVERVRMPWRRSSAGRTSRRRPRSRISPAVRRWATGNCSPGDCRPSTKPTPRGCRKIGGGWIPLAPRSASRRRCWWRRMSCDWKRCRWTSPAPCGDWNSAAGRIPRSIY